MREAGWRLDALAEHLGLTRERVRKMEMQARED
jgi:DNA-directed RNA polymerase sigma subunit (sigma70/sigma32)